jgi:hypothetical protein
MSRWCDDECPHQALQSSEIIAAGSFSEFAVQIMVEKSNAVIDCGPEEVEFGAKPLRNRLVAQT